MCNAIRARRQSIPGEIVGAGKDCDAERLAGTTRESDRTRSVQSTAVVYVCFKSNTPAVLSEKVPSLAEREKAPPPHS